MTLAARGFDFQQNGDSVEARWYDSANGVAYGVLTTDRDQLWKSTDDGENWSLEHDFADGRIIEAVVTTSTSIFVSDRDGNVDRAPIGTTTFASKITLTNTSKVIRGWGVDVRASDELVAWGEYEGQPVSAASNVYTTDADGDNKTTIYTTPSGGHIHAVDWMPDGRLMVSEGDGNQGNGVSTVTIMDADGSNQVVVIDDVQNDQVIEAVFRGEEKLLAADSATLGYLLRKLDADNNLTRTVSATLPQLGFVFALTYDAANGMTYFITVPGSGSTFLWASRDFGETAIPVREFNGGLGYSRGLILTDTHVLFDEYRFPRTARLVEGATLSWNGLIQSCGGVVHYRLNDSPSGNGETLHDEFGNNDGEYVDTGDALTDAFDSSLVLVRTGKTFDRANGHFAKIASPGAALAPAHNHTILCIARFSEVANNRYLYGYAVDGQNYYGLVRSGTELEAFGRISNLNHGEKSSGLSLQADTLYCIAHVMGTDQSSSALYVNGVAVGTGTGPTTSWNTGEFDLGAKPSGIATLDGAIFDWAYLDRKLSAAEVAWLNQKLTYGVLIPKKTLNQNLRLGV